MFLHPFIHSTNVLWVCHWLDVANTNIGSRPHSPGTFRLVRNHLTALQTILNFQTRLNFSWAIIILLCLRVLTSWCICNTNLMGKMELRVLDLNLEGLRMQCWERKLRVQWDSSKEQAHIHRMRALHSSSSPVLRQNTRLLGIRHFLTQRCINPLQACPGWFTSLPTVFLAKLARPGINLRAHSELLTSS